MRIGAKVSRGRSKSGFSGVTVREVGKHRMKEQSWRGLADRLERKLRELGVQVPKKDLFLLGDLQDLDARCQALPLMIEAISEITADPEKWEEFGSHIGWLLAEVKSLRDCATSVEPPLERLLSKICAVQNPVQHLEKVSNRGHE